MYYDWSIRVIIDIKKKKNLGPKMLSNLFKVTISSYI